jgi:hypothetical protein
MIHQLSFVDGVTHARVKSDLARPMSLLRVCHIEEGFVYGDFTDTIKDGRVLVEEF